jgi:hypothetical protein
MGLFENCVERATALAAACGWLAFGSGGTEAAVGVAIGLAGLTTLVSNTVRRHGPESQRALRAIRRQVEGDLRAQADAERWDIGGDLKAADDAMERALAGCFLDRQALAASARSHLGFPGAATELIMVKLAEREPDYFGAEASEHSRDFAQKVIHTALEAAISNEQYFRELEPQLIMAMLHGIGKVELQLETIKTIVTDTQAITNKLQSGHETFISASEAYLRESHKRITKTQDLLLMKRIHSDIAANIFEQRHKLAAAIVEMATHYKLVHHPEEFYDAPWDALDHIAAFVCDFKRSEIGNITDVVDIINTANIGPEVTYHTFLMIQGIHYGSSHMWELIKEIYKNIDLKTSLAYQWEWESSQKIHWLWHQHRYYEAMKNKLSKSIVDGTIKATPIQRAVLSAIASPSEEYRDILEEYHNLLSQIEPPPWSLPDRAAEVSGD